MARIRAGKQRYLDDWLVFRDDGLEYKLKKSHNLLTQNMKNRRYYPTGPEKQFGAGGSSHGGRLPFRKGEDQRGLQRVP